MNDAVLARAPARAVVNLAAIRHNMGILKRVCADLGSTPMVVLKADAYGHGAVRIARELTKVGVEAFATATVVEAVELRNNGVTAAKILVLGAPLPEDLQLVLQHRLDVMITSLDVAHAVTVFCAPLDAPLNVHIYVETGMTRLGLSADDAPKALETLSAAQSIKVVGVCSHFAESDSPESNYVEEQMATFDRAVRAVHQHPLGRNLRLDIHFGNSGALLDARFHVWLGQRYHGGFSRPGIALYGYYPQVSHRCPELSQEPSATRPWTKQILRHETADEQLAEAMMLVVRVTNVMEVEAGTSVGYSRTWTAPKRCLIGTLGIGYADGYPRLSSNKAQVSIRGQYYRVVGNVCMDMTMVSLGDPDGPGRFVVPGDDAIMFGPGGLSATELAWHCETIHYELLSGLTRRVQRIYIDDEELLREQLEHRRLVDTERSSRL
eukprot:TRINITY_DN15684_c0_g1_i3.p1 TRINITY_DN15684_c0_g1~~TRINITY_DN15684_c0_g1_i3.p1  ORF type:complete len:437 (-),score=54.37 TRINITY_DN15684_c0_g1_i3:61-1371(-)